MSAGADAAAALSFRARQHGGVPAVVAAHGSGAAQPLPPILPCGDSVGAPDTRRCILHLDVDAFYAQVEELRDPSLRNVPMARRSALKTRACADAFPLSPLSRAQAVTQKYIVVTCNYAARAQGVGKLMLISAARAACPALRLVPGEDLTPYRRMSAAFLAVLSRFGPTEKLGMDEAWVDVTAAAAAAAAAQPPPRFVGHVHAAAAAVAAHNRHRPMDLSAQAQSNNVAGDAADLPVAHAPACGSDALLAAGSGIAAQVRAALRAELGLRASAGVAHNKLLSKLVSGLHKPDDQTALPAAEAVAFLAPLPVRCLRGVGAAAEAALAALGVDTVAALAAQPRAALARALGDRVATALYEAARGRDASPVVAKAAPRAVSVEDSFRGVSSRQGAEDVLRVLAPDLVARCAEERARDGRRPRTLTLRWRLAPAAAKGGAAQRGSQRASASAPMPEEVSSRGAGGVGAEAAAAAVHRAAALLLRRHLREPFVLTLLNIGATAFTAGGSGGGEQGNNGAPMMGTMQGAMPPPPGDAARAAAAAVEARRSYARGAGALVSKRAERALREGPGLFPEPSLGAAADVAAELAAERWLGDDDGGGACSGDDDAAGGSDGAWSDDDDDVAALALLTGGGRAHQQHAPAASPGPQPPPLPPYRAAAAALAPSPPPPLQPQQGLLRFFGSPAVALPPHGDAVDGAAPAQRCAECGRALRDAAAAVEHADWHMARALQRAERAEPPPPQGRGNKSKGGPLDAFVRRGAPQ